MTRRNEIQNQRHSLIEIREIMNSMKTLAYMETRKLEQFIHAQQQVVNAINQAATAFIQGYPGMVSQQRMSSHRVSLLVGSERGFCGDFNHLVLRQFLQSYNPEQAQTIIVVGRKLHSLLVEQKQESKLDYIEGATVVEDVPEVINHIVNLLTEIQQVQGPITLNLASHTEDGDVSDQQLLPAFQHQGEQRSAVDRPLLNLTPEVFLLGLSEQYLFSILYEKLYSSLVAENHRRVTHLEGAVHHLDDRAEDLARRLNTLRQEEIIEEIEVILLSASSLAKPEAGAER